MFVGNENNQGLADLLEVSHPNCACESFSIGDGSPGVVADEEMLLRIIISPRDIDPETGEIAVRPFEKVFKNGLSVMRSVASDADIEAVVKEGLEASGQATRKVETLLGVTAHTVRSILAEGMRIFCVYDQTVRRKDDSLLPVPTHAGVFQRFPPKGAEGRKVLQKDFARLLHKKFVEGKIPVSEFRGGQLLGLGQQSNCEIVSISSNQDPC